MEGFKQGVKDSMSANLLHAAFKVRTNQLFNALSKTENYGYLSGLLIGEELKDITSSQAEMIYLAAGSNLSEYYKTALEVLQISKPVHIFPPDWVDEAVVRGHLKIGHQLKMLA